MRGKNGFCAVGGGSVIGFIAAIRGGRIEEMFFVQREFNGGGSSRYAAKGRQEGTLRPSRLRRDGRRRELQHYRE